MIILLKNVINLKALKFAFTKLTFINRLAILSAGQRQKYRHEKKPIVKFF